MLSVVVAQANEGVMSCNIARSKGSYVMGDRSHATYWELGKLPPDLNTPELKEKKAAQQRAWGYAEQVRALNQEQLRRQDKPPRKDSSKQQQGREPTKAERMMQFAKSIPPPETKRSAPSGERKAERGEGGNQGYPRDELTALELQNLRDRQQVQRIASEIGA